MRAKNIIKLLTSDIIIPDHLGKKYNIEGFSLRSFGSSLADLEINFESRTVINSIKLMTNCVRKKSGEPIDEDFFWELPISKRIEIIVNIAFLNENDILNFTFSCKNETCQEKFEIELKKPEFFDYLHSHNNHISIPIKIDERKAIIRKPTSLDQINWIENYVNRPDKSIQVVLNLVSIISGRSKFKEINISKNIKAINLEFEKLDPILNLTKTLECPYCKVNNDFFLDLNNVALQKLYSIQKRLINSIHRIASMYHWNENEIISISKWRRDEYIHLIKSGGEIP